MTQPPVLATRVRCRSSNEAAVASEDQHDQKRVMSDGTVVKMKESLQSVHEIATDLETKDKKLRNLEHQVEEYYQRYDDANKASNEAWEALKKKEESLKKLRPELTQLEHQVQQLKERIRLEGLERDELKRKHTAAREEFRTISSEVGKLEPEMWELQSEMRNEAGEVARRIKEITTKVI